MQWHELNFHFQRHPKPGNEWFRVNIDLFEQEVVDRINSLAKADMHSPMCSDNILIFQSSYNNRVSFALNYFKRKNPETPTNIKWILNKTTKIRFEKNSLVIEGVASNFDPLFFS